MTLPIKLPAFNPETLALIAFGGTGVAAAVDKAHAKALLTLTRDRVRLRVYNAFDKDVTISITLPGGTIADFDVVKTGTSQAWDGAAFPSGTIVSFWATGGVAPASGSIYMSSH
jgi:hypothetical protein